MSEKIENKIDQIDDKIEKLINDEIKLRILTKDLNTPEVSSDHSKQFFLKICIDTVKIAKEKGKSRCHVDIVDCNSDHVEFAFELFKRLGYQVSISDFLSYKYLNISWI